LGFNEHSGLSHYLKVSALAEAAGTAVCALRGWYE